MNKTPRHLVNQLLDRCLAVFVLFVSLFAGAQAWAQNLPGTPPPSPSPGLAPASKSWLWIIMALFLFACVMLISLKPGKRSHQD